MSGQQQQTQSRPPEQNMNIGAGEEVNRREPFIIKVYATLFVMLLTTIVMVFFFFRQQRAASTDQQQHNRHNIVNPGEEARNVQDGQDGQHQNNQGANQSRQILKRYQVADSNLRKISISAMDLLVEKKSAAIETDAASSLSSQLGGESEYTFNTDMLEFLRAVRNKYRIYVLTNLALDTEKEQEDKIGKQKQKVHEMLLKLCKQDIIKGSHRLMYSSSEVGHIAQIRHLAADLHIENDFQIVKSLLQHMNKFHLIMGERAGHRAAQADSKEEMDQFVRRHAGKVLFFKDTVSYSAKIKDAMSKNSR